MTSGSGVTVALACYNQAQYLDEALDSVQGQHPAAEQVVVVDDGSTDNTAEVVRRRSGVEYEFQSNQGLSAARNTGWRCSRGDAVVFLDADDLLLPGALGAGWACLQRHPQAAFVSGHYQFVDQHGQRLPTWRELHHGDEQQFTTGSFQRIRADGSLGRRRWRPQRTCDHYSAMLRRNFIGMHATVMYRRQVFEQVGGFDTRLPCCEDYEMFLRITRTHPVACHDAVVALYRRHSAGMSRRTRLMLQTVLQVLDAQLPLPTDRPAIAESLREGRRFWKWHFGKQLVRDLPARVKTGDWGELNRSLQTIAALVGLGDKDLLRVENDRRGAENERSGRYRTDAEQ